MLRGPTLLLSRLGPGARLRRGSERERGREQGMKEKRGGGGAVVQNRKKS